MSKNKLQLLITLLLPCMCSQQICPSNVTFMSHMPISSCADMRQLYPYIYTSMKIWPGALVYMHSKLMAYAHDQNMPVILQKYLPLHCYCSLHTNPTFLHISMKKINNLQHLFTTLLQNMCQQQICPSNATCPNCSTCTNWGSMPIYMPYMNLLALIMWPGVLYTYNNDANTDTNAHNNDKTSRLH